MSGIHNDDLCLLQSTQQKITDVKWLTNIFDVHLLSVCSPFGECSCALFVHWNICAQIVNRTFVHKRLTNILDISLLSVCAQMGDNILDDHLLSVCAQTVDRYFGMKRKRKFNENQENNTFGEIASNYHKKKNPYIGQQTDSKWMCDVLVHKWLRGQIYIHLL